MPVRVARRSAASPARPVGARTDSMMLQTASTKISASAMARV
jgi:hypothetical protein